MVLLLIPTACFTDLGRAAYAEPANTCEATPLFNSSIPTQNASDGEMFGIIRFMIVGTRHLGIMGLGGGGCES